MTQGQEIEYRGEWWDPGTPERTVAGTLHLPRHGPGYVEVEEALPGAPPVLLGTTTYRTRVSLLGCRHLKGAGAANCCAPDIVLLGGHWTSLKEIRLESLWIEFNGLEAWWGEGNPLPLNEDEAVPLIECPGLSIVLWNRVLDSYSFVRGERLDAERHVSICLTASGGRPYPGFGPLLDEIQTLLSFCFGAAVYPTSLTGHLLVPDAASEEAPPEPALPIHIRPSGFRLDRPDPLLHLRRPEPLVRLDGAGTPGTALLSRWIEDEGRLGLSRTLALSLLFGPRPTSEQEFLALTEALGIYHRASGRFSLTRYDPLRYGERVDKALAALSKKWRRRLLEPFGDGNSPSLAERLDALLGAHAEVAPYITPDPGGFGAAAGACLRGLEGEGDRPGADEVAVLAAALWQLWYACQLDELGFETAAIAAVLRRRLGVADPEPDDIPQDEVAMEEEADSDEIARDPDASGSTPTILETEEPGEYVVDQEADGLSSNADGTETERAPASTETSIGV